MHRRAAEKTHLGSLGQRSRAVPHACARAAERTRGEGRACVRSAGARQKWAVARDPLRVGNFQVSHRPRVFTLSGGARDPSPLCPGGGPLARRMRAFVLPSPRAAWRTRPAYRPSSASISPSSLERFSRICVAQWPLELCDFSGGLACGKGKASAEGFGKSSCGVVGLGARAWQVDALSKVIIL